MLKNTSEVTGEETPLIGWVDAVINFVQSHRRINAVDTDKHILTNQCIYYLCTADLVTQGTFSQSYEQAFFQ